MRQVACVISALVLLASCASKPPKECPEGLYLPAHIPERCEPKKEESGSSMKPQEKDPIVGAYLIYPSHNKYRTIMRVYPDGSAKLSNWHILQFRWESKETGAYEFSFDKRSNYASETLELGVYTFDELLRAYRYADTEGAPNLVSTELGRLAGKGSSEGIKVSTDPEHVFDFFNIRHVKTEGWLCVNIGRMEYQNRKTGNVRLKDLRGAEKTWFTSLSDCQNALKSIEILNR